MENLAPSEDNIIAARKALNTASRSSSLNLLGLAGRKTGVTLKSDVIVQDDDALDNIETFWSAALASPDVPARASILKETAPKTPTTKPTQTYTFRFAAASSQKSLSATEATVAASPSSKSFAVKDILRLTEDSHHTSELLSSPIRSMRHSILPVPKTPSQFSSEPPSLEPTQDNDYNALSAPLDNALSPELEVTATCTSPKKTKVQFSPHAVSKVSEAVTKSTIGSPIFTYEKTPIPARNSFGIDDLTAPTSPAKAIERSSLPQLSPEEGSFAVSRTINPAYVLDTETLPNNESYGDSERQLPGDNEQAYGVMDNNPMDDSIIFSYGDEFGQMDYTDNENQLPPPLDSDPSGDSSGQINEHDEVEKERADEQDASKGDGMMDEYVDFSASEALDEPVDNRKKATRTARLAGNRSFDKTLSETAKLLDARGDDLDADEAHRKSSRRKFRPLEFWKNERVVYGRRESCALLRVPAILDVITVPEDNEKKSKAGGDSKKHLRNRGFHPKKSATGTVFNPYKQDDSTELVMIHYENLVPKQFPGSEKDGTSGFLVYNDSFPNFKAVDASFGLLLLPKNSKKPNLNSGEFNLRFFVHQGVVRVTIHKVSFIAHPGCEFFVPEGNQYEITNLHSRESKLYYVHIKGHQRDLDVDERKRSGKKSRKLSDDDDDDDSEPIRKRQIKRSH